MYLFPPSPANGFQGLVSRQAPPKVWGPLHNTSESTSVATQFTFMDAAPIEPSLPHHTAHDLSQVLTAREIMVAQMVSQGLPNKKIASQLSISVGTTKTHLHHIYQKLNCAGRLGLAIQMHKMTGIK